MSTQTQLCLFTHFNNSHIMVYAATLRVYRKAATGFCTLNTVVFDVLHFFLSAVSSAGTLWPLLNQDITTGHKKHVLCIILFKVASLL